MRLATALLICIGASAIAAPAHADGACCLMPCYVCVITTMEDCEQQGGIWFGEGTACEPAP